ncbi:MAG: DUF362 domain-containing protein [Nitrospinae bacterium]|nr:DUF362 domain-containing protein [Nitrospinota bacterium]
MATEVSIVRSYSYSYDEVYGSVRRSIELLGGMERFVKKGDKVLLKPNLLSAKSPERAITTHPVVVKAVGNLVRETGGIPFIGDSPAIGNWGYLTRKTGMEEVAKEIGAELVPFSESVRMRNDNDDIFKYIEIAKVVQDADVVINLPKIKTHTQMLLTLSVKNLFGCVVGKRKPQLHMEVGRDREYFARMLVEIYKAIMPSLTIVDGIIGIEGNGPGAGGTLKEIGLIIGGRDCIAIDVIICKILGVKKENLYTTTAAIKMGIGETDMERIKILGEDIEGVRVKGFMTPAIKDVEFGPRFLRRYIKDLFTSRPIEEKERCNLCRLCMEICPPQVIKVIDGKLSFNYDKCIRCYCCIEVCPEGAMGVKETFMSRLTHQRLY